jgi:hypothetical protein
VGKVHVLKKTEDLTALLRDDDVLQIGLNCKRSDIRFPVAYQILTTRKEIVRNCFEGETRSGGEVYNQ